MQFVFASGDPNVTHDATAEHVELLWRLDSITSVHPSMLRHRPAGPFRPTLEILLQTSVASDTETSASAISTCQWRLEMRCANRAQAARINNTAWRMWVTRPVPT